MADEGWTTVSIRSTLYERAKRLAEDSTPPSNPTRVVNDALENYLEEVES